MALYNRTYKTLHILHCNNVSVLYHLQDTSHPTARWRDGLSVREPAAQAATSPRPAAQAPAIPPHPSPLTQP